MKILNAFVDTLLLGVACVCGLCAVVPGFAAVVLLMLSCLFNSLTSQYGRTR